MRDLEAAASYVQEVRLEEAIAGLQTSVGEFVDEVKRSEIAAAVAAAGRKAPKNTGSIPVGGSRGGHSDAWWHGVAICEQGGRNDPYFGYFSFMDGSQGGKPWDEQVAAGNALLARAGREVGPWAAACVAAGYRASPGG